MRMMIEAVLDIFARGKSGDFPIRRQSSGLHY